MEGSGAGSVGACSLVCCHRKTDGEVGQFIPSGVASHDPVEYGVFHSGGAAAFLDDGDGPAVEAFGVSAFAKHREPLEPIPLAT